MEMSQTPASDRPLSMSRYTTFFPGVFLAIATLLFVWGFLGVVEYAFPSVQIGLQNPKFPAGLQFLHFASILATGGIFLAGYLVRWRQTPFATTLMYAVLATLCFIETVDFEAFGGGPTRFIPMALEYAAYIGLSAYLLRARKSREYFRQGQTGSKA